MIRHDSSRARRGGFTLVDVCVAMLILLVGVGGFAGSIFTSMRMASVHEETATADAELGRLLEEIESVEFNDVFATYNEEDDDDPGGKGTAPGEEILVRVLDAVEGADVQVAEISFPVVEELDGTIVLREDLEDESFGLPRDLNGDGEIDDQNHADDYVILPIKIRLEWEGVTGERFLEHQILLVE